MSRFILLYIGPCAMVSAIFSQLFRRRN